MHFAHFGETFAGDPHQTACPPQSRAAAIGTIVIHHHLLQVCLHPVHTAALLAVPMVMPLNLAHDSLEGHLLANVLFSLARAFRQDNLDLFPLAAMEDQVLYLVWKVRERDVEAKSIVLCETVKPSPAPSVLIVVEGFFHDCAVPQGAAWIRHQER